MQHTIKQIAGNFNLDYDALLRYAIINNGRYGIHEEDGVYTTTTLFTEDFIEAFRNKDTAIYKIHATILESCKHKDFIYAGSDPKADNFNQVLVSPIFGKTLEDIKFLNNKKPKFRLSQYINTKGKLYELNRVYGHGNNNTLYVITIDKKIAYYTFCSIFRPASSAFEALTEVYPIRFNSEIGSCVYGSLYPAEYYSASLLPTFRKELFEVVSNVDEAIRDIYTHF